MMKSHLGDQIPGQCQERLRELRKLAAWYREFAERAGNAAIWELRLRTADELRREADRLEAEMIARPFPVLRH
jgi:hypothetical protein